MAKLVSTARGGLTIKHNLPTDAQLGKMFDMVPILERYKVADQTLRAGVRPIVSEAKRITPLGTDDPTQKRTRAKRSARQRREADWVTHLRHTIKSVVRTKRSRGGGVAVAGPEWKGRTGAGQKVYLVAEWKKKYRVVRYWGRTPKGMQPKIKRKVRNIMLDAANHTLPQQNAAMHRKLKLIMDDIWKRSVRV